MNEPLQHRDILAWLRETDPVRLQELWRRADAVRRDMVGDAVHLRGLIEFSNHCVRRCGYCGLRVGSAVARYRMSAEEILACAHEAVAYGYGTVVLQSGEDPGTTTAWMSDLVRRITAETPLAVTLSLGERSADDLRAWRAAGADRYLLRFETSDRELYDRIHPPRAGQAAFAAEGEHPRFAILRLLRELDYEVGSGVLLGIPGQTWESVARDIAAFAALDLDMIGVGPYIPHPDTPLGKAGSEGLTAGADQVPRDELTAYKVVALARLTCPRANIPSTTALATLNLATGRELGLLRGANIVMPNLTPVAYRSLYEIYPDKACIAETASQCHGCLRRRIESIGREIGSGRGDARRRAPDAGGGAAAP